MGVWGKVWEGGWVWKWEVGEDSAGAADYHTYVPALGLGLGMQRDDPDCHPPPPLGITNGIAAYVNERSQPSGKFCFSVSVSQEIEMVPVETRTDIHPRWIRLGPRTSVWEIFALRIHVFTCTESG